MRKRVNQKMTINKKTAVTYSIKRNNLAIHSKKLEILLRNLSVLTQPLQLSINCLNQLNPLQKPQSNRCTIKKIPAF